MLDYAVDSGDYATHHFGAVISKEALHCRGLNVGSLPGRQANTGKIWRIDQNRCLTARTQVSMPYALILL